MEAKKTDRELRNIWIMKPGESTNRGNGISVCFTLDDVHLRLKSKERNRDGSLRTFILQKYMERPLLFHGRKFDIRHYVLVTCFAGSFRGYWYEQGYVRTSSSPYSLRNNRDLFVHLTNDAVQKNCDTYGKYEPGNKVSYDDLEKYISKASKRDNIGRAVSFNGEILPRMREIALDSLRATYHLLDRTRRHHNFELLGLDFMIDDAYRPFLIEVNTNPCLELSCPLLEAIIPPLVENTLRYSLPNAESAWIRYSRRPRACRPARSPSSARTTSRTTSSTSSSTSCCRGES
jgi:tubulin polyglutamylase TTLL1/tubulin monoglycylase TTLL3/8